MCSPNVPGESRKSSRRGVTTILTEGDLATLQAPVDAFFDDVMVNAENSAVRANRYALLAQLRGLFLSVADISVPG